VFIGHAYRDKKVVGVFIVRFSCAFTKSHSDLKRLQQKETIKRYQFINDVLKVG
jgi:hypothetical protein